MLSGDDVNVCLVGVCEHIKFAIDFDPECIMVIKAKVNDPTTSDSEYELDDFARAYIECALEHSGPAISHDYRIEDIEYGTLTDIKEACEEFQGVFVERYEEHLGEMRSQHRSEILKNAGRALWITSAGYGMNCGFLNRSLWRRQLGDQLAERASSFGGFVFGINQHDQLERQD